MNNVPNNFSLAPVYKRGIAALIDFLLLFLVPVFFNGTIEAILRTDGKAPFFPFMLIIISYQVYLLSTKGQTIGKKSMNIRIVVKDTGENGGFLVNVILRNLISIFYFFRFVVFLDTIFIFSENKQCLHDKIAGTVVIDLNEVNQEVIKVRDEIDNSGVLPVAYPVNTITVNNNNSSINLFKQENKVKEKKRTDKTINQKYAQTEIEPGTSFMIKNKSELDGINYFEILPGKFNGQCWNGKSVFFEEEDWELFAGLVEKHFPEYNHYSLQAIYSQDWQKIYNDLVSILEKIKNGAKLSDIRNELLISDYAFQEMVDQEEKSLLFIKNTITEFTNWIKPNLDKEGCISILGV